MRRRRTRAGRGWSHDGLVEAEGRAGRAAAIQGGARLVADLRAGSSGGLGGARLRPPGRPRPPARGSAAHRGLLLGRGGHARRRAVRGSARRRSGPRRPDRGGRRGTGAGRGGRPRPRENRNGLAPGGRASRRRPVHDRPPAPPRAARGGRLRRFRAPHPASGTRSGSTQRSSARSPAYAPHAGGAAVRPFSRSRRRSSAPGRRPAAPGMRRAAAREIAERMRGLVTGSGWAGEARRPPNRAYPPRSAAGSPRASTASSIAR
jgi:hypothetical protein